MKVRKGISGRNLEKIEADTAPGPSEHCQSTKEGGSAEGSEKEEEPELCAQNPQGAGSEDLMGSLNFQ